MRGGSFSRRGSNYRVYVMGRQRSLESYDAVEARQERAESYPEISTSSHSEINRYRARIEREIKFLRNLVGILFR